LFVASIATLQASGQNIMNRPGRMFERRSGGLRGRKVRRARVVDLLKEIEVASAS
jgi:hypothetical protein